VDLTVFKKSSLFCNRNNMNLYGTSQYILGDSGYMPLEHMVAAYKRSETSQDKEDFNTCVAKCRVTNEHFIGVWKSRWHSLKRVELNENKDSAWLVHWIVLCARLHKFVISQNDHWTKVDDANILEHVDSFEQGEAETAPTQLTNRQIRANQLKLQNEAVKYALEFHRQPGGILYHAV
jgi:hypothetical protein